MTAPTKSPARPETPPGDRPRAPKIPASDAVRKEWLRRVQAEYRSAAITQHLTLWLIQIAASPDLLDAGLRIVKDELTHARMSHRVYTVAGGRDLPGLSQDTLGLKRPEQEPLWMSVARAGVEVFCLGETVAVPLFKVLREGCTQPVSRQALDRILRDEVRHRDFGWTLLEWLASSPVGEAVVTQIRAELPRMFARLRRSYGLANAPSPAGARLRSTTVPAEDRAWGLMGPSRYAEILERTVERDYVPRFAAHGIDARAAWEASASIEQA